MANTSSKKASDAASKGDEPKPTPTFFKAPTPEEANKRAIENGQAPIDYSPTFVRPLTDPAPTMEAHEQARMFLAPIVGGEQPDWFDGVVRPERMTSDERELYNGELKTVKSTHANADVEPDLAGLSDEDVAAASKTEPA